MASFFQDNLGKRAGERLNQSGFEWCERWWGGNGISWAIFASRCKQITTPAPHQSIYYRPGALPDAMQLCQSTEDMRERLAISDTRNSSGDEIANVNFFMPTSSTTFMQCAPEATESSEIKQNKGHYAVQGHSRSPILVQVESSYTTSY